MDVGGGLETVAKTLNLNLNISQSITSFVQSEAGTKDSRSSERSRDAEEYLWEMLAIMASFQHYSAY